MEQKVHDLILVCKVRDPRLAIPSLPRQSRKTSLPLAGAGRMPS